MKNILEKMFRKGKIDNLFILLFVQKGIYFKSGDIDKYGNEMLEALYMEGLL